MSSIKEKNSYHLTSMVTLISLSNNWAESKQAGLVSDLHVYILHVILRQSSSLIGGAYRVEGSCLHSPHHGSCDKPAKQIKWNKINFLNQDLTKIRRIHVPSTCR